jgi:hypothetical protein
MSHPGLEQFEHDELNGLFAEYRASMPDRDPGAGFMPELWQKIEARKRFVFRMKRLTQVFVAAAAALCLVFATFLSVPEANLDSHGSYVDVLADAFPAENLSAHGILQVSYEDNGR